MNWFTNWFEVNKIEHTPSVEIIHECYIPSVEIYTPSVEIIHEYIDNCFPDEDMDLFGRNLKLWNLQYNYQLSLYKGTGGDLIEIYEIKFKNTLISWIDNSLYSTKGIKCFDSTITTEQLKKGDRS